MATTSATDESSSTKTAKKTSPATKSTKKTTATKKAAASKTSSSNKETKVETPKPASTQPSSNNSETSSSPSTTQTTNQSDSLAQQLPTPQEYNRNNNNRYQNNRSNGRGGRRNRRNGAVPVNNARNFSGQVDGRWIPDAGVPTEMVTGILDMKSDGNGILREKYSGGHRDAYISGSQIRRFKLRPGDEIAGPARQPKDNEQFWGLLKVEKVNGHSIDAMAHRVRFHDLTPVYPDKKIVLETEPGILTTRMIDLVAPVGRGQRGLIVSPPKAGKTTTLKDIASGIAKNFSDIHLMAVLVGERPEEVTDIRRHIEHITEGKGEVAASNFDEQATEQVRVSELALERARRLVEMGNHVVILLDSITRLARAYNLAMPTSGRTLSGGFDPAALYPPKKFFGAARNFEEFDTPDGKQNASLTILGTALTDTGSRMDDLIYEEFKGTGNMELHLDRNLAERRIYPAIDVMRSGTRKEDLLFDNTEYQSVILMRRMLDMLDQREQTSVLVDKMKRSKNNKEFLATLKEG